LAITGSNLTGVDTGEAALLKLLAALPDASRRDASRRDAERSLARVHLDPDVWFHAPEPAPYYYNDGLRDVW